MGRPSCKRLGGTDLRLPVVGQGTWNMERDPERAGKALRLGVELGLTHIDTAEIYGDGAVEAIVGRALEGLRDKVQLVSKVNPVRATRKGLARACEESLRRLRTEYLDVYLLHWLPPHPVKEVVDGFEDLVRRGRIRYWGVSNIDESTLREFIRVAGPGRICCNQLMHHLGQRCIEHSLVPFCSANDIGVVGYSPFGAGAFPDASTAGGRVLRKIAAPLGATPRQVALAFLVAKSGGFTIPKAVNRMHVVENAGTAALELPPEAVARLERAFPRGKADQGAPLAS